MTVVSVNDLPTAEHDVASVTQNSSVSIDVLDNERLIPIRPMFLSLPASTTRSHGTAVIVKRSSRLYARHRFCRRRRLHLFHQRRQRRGQPSRNPGHGRRNRIIPMERVVVLGIPGKREKHPLAICRESLRASGFASGYHLLVAELAKSCLPKVLNKPTKNG
ncbi:MAG: hypothetical protein MZU97_16325 [Bacillus subtilis]|nr:hypothetical protein [Bacillus subtilis]